MAAGGRLTVTSLQLLQGSLDTKVHALGAVAAVVGANLFGIRLVHGGKFYLWYQIWV